MDNIKIIFLYVQLPLIGLAIFFAIKSMYHGHQADRIMSKRGKQTFWQWIRHIDTPRGTGIWQ